MKGEFETKSYFFMRYAEWFFVDEKYNITLTQIAEKIPKCVRSYNKYLRDLEKKED